MLLLRSQHRNSAEGFTLLEVLLAVFIGSILLTALYSSFFQIIKAKDTVETELEAYHEARTILARLSRDFEAAYPRGRVFPTSLAAEDFFLGTRASGGQSAVTFTSLSHDAGLNPRDSDQALISYYLAPLPDGDLFYLMRRESSKIGVEGDALEYPISDRVVAFEILYFRNTEEGFVPEWSSAQSASLPRAVAVALTMRSPRGEDLRFESFVAIPAAN
ncbi:MAG: prepilin-type N-terminal cleavage/methylation domain-containing protein [Deltaproteobacteria bacterium]